MSSQVKTQPRCKRKLRNSLMLDNGLCGRAIVSDISEKSLSKAQVLLADYIKNGVCRAVCCNGLEKVKGADTVLIAGIGGEPTSSKVLGLPSSTPYLKRKTFSSRGVRLLRTCRNSAKLCFSTYEKRQGIAQFPFTARLCFNLRRHFSLAFFIG